VAVGVDFEPAPDRSVGYLCGFGWNESRAAESGSGKVDVTVHLDRNPIPTAMALAPALGLGPHVRRDADPGRAELIDLGRTPRPRGTAGIAERSVQADGEDWRMRRRGRDRPCDRLTDRSADRRAEC
jgi:hypothetical protein